VEDPVSAATPEDEKLGADGRALLDAAASGLEPSDADRKRVRISLAAAIAAGAAGATAGATSSAAAASVSMSLGVKVAIAVVALAAAGGGLAYVQRSMTPAPVAHSAAATTHDPLARTTNVTPVARRTTAPLRALPQPSAPALPSAVDAIAPTPPAAPAAEPRGAARPRNDALPAPAEPAAVPSLAQATPTPAALDELPAETALLRRAQAALSLHTETSAGEALAALDEHARRFPAGTLAEEREATRALALCAAGRIGEAQGAARSFLAAHPTSPLAHRVRAACPAE
jgi:hypothetical protein